MTPSDVSVVIPALNEEAAIANSVRSARQAGAEEVIIADGGSDDRTYEAARSAGASKFVRSFPGRGTQLNAGAALAEGEVLLFLHADNCLGKDCLQQICDERETAWGAFRQRIDSPRRIYRWIERGNAWRVRYRRMPFGDQAIFVRRDWFVREGGFAEVPLMEDVEFSKRMRKRSAPHLLDGPVTIDARRWEANGAIGQTLRNWSIQVSYALGTSPETLRKRYR